MKNCLLVLLYMICLSHLFAQKMSGNYLAKYSMAVKSVAWRADGKYFAACGDSFVVLWRADTNTIATVYDGSKALDKKGLDKEGALESESAAYFVSVSFSDNGKWLLGVRSDNSAFVWNLEDDFKIETIHQDGLFIDDAAFLGNGYRIVMLGEGSELTEYFKLVQTGEVLIDKRVSFPIKVNSLDVSRDKKKVLSVCDDGVIALIDTKDWNVSMPFDWEVSKEMKARFSADGEYFLGKVSQSTIRIAAVEGGKKSINITDEDGFSNVAVFSDDSKFIAAGTKNSLVRIYTVSSLSTVKRELKLAKGDTATAIEYSPDGEYLIVGTEKGYVLRMRKDGKLYSYREKRYKDSDLVGLGEGLGAGEGGEGTGRFKIGDSIDLLASYSTLSESYYIGSFGVEGEYRNRKLIPDAIEKILPNSYWGVSVACSIGVPSYDFPYYYKSDNVVLNPPYVYCTGLYFLVGYEYVFGSEGDFSLFAEVKSGGAFRVLCNNNIRYLHTGKVYPSVSEELIVGLQYKMLVLSGGANFDSNVGLLWNCSAGLSIGL